MKDKGARGRSKSRGRGQGTWKGRSKSRVGEDRNKCFYCKEEGHWKRNCPKLKGNWKNASKASEASSSMVASSSEEEKSEVLMVSTSCTHDNWIMDSGCTYHMTSRRE